MNSIVRSLMRPEKGLSRCFRISLRLNYLRGTSTQDGLRGAMKSKMGVRTLREYLSELGW